MEIRHGEKEKSQILPVIYDTWNQCFFALAL